MRPKGATGLEHSRQHQVGVQAPNGMIAGLFVKLRGPFLLCMPKTREFFPLCSRGMIHNYRISKHRNAKFELFGM